MKNGSSLALMAALAGLSSAHFREGIRDQPSPTPSKPRKPVQPWQYAKGMTQAQRDWNAKVERRNKKAGRK